MWGINLWENKYVYKIVVFLLQYYMDSRTSSTDNNIHMSSDICSRRLSHADFDLNIMQCAKLDRTEGEKVNWDLSKSLCHHIASARCMGIYLENSAWSSQYCKWISLKNYVTFVQICSIHILSKYIFLHIFLFLRDHLNLPDIYWLLILIGYLKYRFHFHT